MNIKGNELYRSEDKVIAGVVGGLARYFDVDPTLLRLAAVFVVVATGVVPGIVAYIAAMFIMPEAPQNRIQGVGAKVDGTERKAAHTTMKR